MAALGLLAMEKVDDLEKGHGPGPPQPASPQPASPQPTANKLSLMSQTLDLTDLSSIELTEYERKAERISSILAPILRSFKIPTGFWSGLGQPKHLAGVNQFGKLGLLGGGGLLHCVGASLPERVRRKLHFALAQLCIVTHLSELDPGTIADVAVMKKFGSLVTSDVLENLTRMIENKPGSSYEPYPRPPDDIAALACKLEIGFKSTLSGTRCDGLQFNLLLSRNEKCMLFVRYLGTIFSQRPRVWLSNLLKFVLIMVLIALFVLLVLAVWILLTMGPGPRPVIPYNL